MITTILLSLTLMVLLFIMVWAAAALIQDRRLLSTGPKDVIAAVQEHPERFRGQRVLGWTILLGAGAGLVSAFVYAGWDGLRHGYRFHKLFGRYLFMLYALKAFDIIALDWYLLSKSHFFQHYFPETEGCAGYKDFGFNQKEQLVRIALFPLAALLLAGICVRF